MSDRQLHGFEYHDCHSSDGSAHCLHSSRACVVEEPPEIAIKEKINHKLIFCCTNFCNVFLDFKRGATFLRTNVPPEIEGLVLFGKKHHTRWVVCTLQGNLK